MRGSRARRCLFCKECIYTSLVQQKKDINEAVSRCVRAARALSCCVKSHQSNVSSYERDVAVAAAVEATAARDAAVAAAETFTRVADGVIVRMAILFYWS